MAMTDISTERRAELLARAPGAALIALAEQSIEERGASPTVIAGPETGMVMMTVREPIARERFHLGEVLVTRAEVEVDGHRGWSMRLGDDRVAALAAAILDAEVAAEGSFAADVIDLCLLTEELDADRDESEWDELGPTRVHFDEID